MQSWLLVPTDVGQEGFGKRFYFSSDKEYDLDKLLPLDVRLKQKLKCSVIPANLVELEPADLQIHKRTWKMWLQHAIDARHYPKLTHVGSLGAFLNPDSRALLSLNPSKFLGTLKAHWDEYQHEAFSIHGELRNCEIMCRSGQFLPLHTTFLPTCQILGRLRELGVPESKTAVLHLPDGELDDALLRQWRFLEDFGACSKPNLRFYQLALEQMESLKETPVSQAKSLYRSMAQLATVEDHANLRYVMSPLLFV